MKRVEQFWDDKPGPYFLVLVNRQINGELHQNGGSAHLNSFQLQLKGNESDSALDHLITHEYIHHWNGWIIKGPPVQDEKDHLDIHWFIEGFTDYLAFSLTNTRPAEKSWQNIPLWELKRNYLNNHNYFDVPYAQGRKIAAEFEREIRASGRSLRDFMLDLLQRSKRDPNFYITRDSFLQVMCEGGYFNCDRARNIIERYVVQGQQFKSQA
jgi:predicted metalloprotease with PDZ domain